MTTASVLSLPVPLILLIHLHILEYPHANRPEYDHSIFDPRVRGLRERTKTLEDICYFLVGRLDRKCKTILPTYPCLQPSDTIAFRTTLTKYLEALRHRSLYPTSKVTTGGSNIRTTDSNNSTAAWWWKDIVVRKSLLEECSGERFERLLLAVSTHALLNGTPASTTVLLENTSSLLRTQPTIYTNLLFRYMSTRHMWSHSASLLLHRHGTLKSLREHIDSHGGSITSKYSSFSTDRLVALTDSKLQDLHRFWRGRNGHQALDFLIMLAGLRALRTGDSPDGSLHIKPLANSANTKPSPLPIAAAHHPSNLKKIRGPVFLSPKRQIRSGGPAEATVPPVIQPMLAGFYAKIALSDFLESEISTRQTLVDSLAGVADVKRSLVARARVPEPKRQSRGLKHSSLHLSLWNAAREAQHQGVKFDNNPTPELLSSLSLHEPNEMGALEARIDYIRHTMLPRYPPISDLSAPRTSTSETPPVKLPTASTRVSPEPSKIPRAISGSAATAATPDSFSQSSIDYVPHAPGPPSSRQPLTSIPPQALKSRSAHTHNVLSTGDIHRRSKAHRKSIRFSLANTRRPSLFATGSDTDGADELEDEVHNIVRGTQDDSTDDLLVPMTPKAKARPVNRIFTGTRTSTVKRPKHSYPVAFQEPAVALPPLFSPSSSVDKAPQGGAYDFERRAEHDMNLPEHQHGSHVEGIAATDGDDSEGEYRNEGPSMTLRDILLGVDATQFDLLDDEDYDPLGDESFEWD